MGAKGIVTTTMFRIIRPALLVLTLLLMFAVAVPVHAQTADEEKAAILALYKGDDIVSTDGKEQGVIRSVAQVKDSFKHYAKDFVIIYSDGRKQTAQQLQDTLIKAFRDGLQSFKGDAEITSFVVKNGTATVEMNAKATMEIKRKDGIVIPLTTESKGRDFWVKEKGVWLIKRSRVMNTKGYDPNGQQIL